MLNYNIQFNEQKNIFNYNNDFFYIRNENDLFINKNKKESMSFFLQIF